MRTRSFWEKSKSRQEWSRVVRRIVRSAKNRRGGRLTTIVGARRRRVEDYVYRWKVEIRNKVLRPRRYMYIYIYIIHIIHHSSSATWIVVFILSIVGYDPVKGYVHASTFYFILATTLYYCSEDSLFPLLVLRSKLDSSKTPVFAVVYTTKSAMFLPMPLCHYLLCPLSSPLPTPALTKACSSFKTVKTPKTTGVPV